MPDCQSVVIQAPLVQTISSQLQIVVGNQRAKICQETLSKASRGADHAGVESRGTTANRPLCSFLLVGSCNLAAPRNTKLSANFAIARCAQCTTEV